MRNLKKQVKKAFCYQKLFWPFNVSDLKNLANSWPSVSNFKFFSRSLEQLFLIVGQNNFGNKILFITYELKIYEICFTHSQWKIEKKIKNSENTTVFLLLNSLESIFSNCGSSSKKSMYRHSSISAVSISRIFDLTRFIILSYFPPLYYYLDLPGFCFACFFCVSPH